MIERGKASRKKLEVGNGLRKQIEETVKKRADLEKIRPNVYGREGCLCQ